MQVIQQYPAVAFLCLKCLLAAVDMVDLVGSAMDFFQKTLKLFYQHSFFKPTCKRKHKNNAQPEIRQTVKETFH